MSQAKAEAWEGLRAMLAEYRAIVAAMLVRIETWDEGDQEEPLKLGADVILAVAGFRKTISDMERLRSAVLSGPVVGGNAASKLNAGITASAMAQTTFDLPELDHAEDLRWVRDFALRAAAFMPLQHRIRMLNEAKSCILQLATFMDTPRGAAEVSGDLKALRDGEIADAGELADLLGVGDG